MAGGIFLRKCASARLLLTSRHRLRLASEPDLKHGFKDMLNSPGVPNQNKKPPFWVVSRFGAPGRIRTCDLPVRSRALYPLSYGRVYLLNALNIISYKIQVVKSFLKFSCLFFIVITQNPNTHYANIPLEFFVDL